ncbi:PTS fructose transporter subunit EIIBC [Verrucomicrobia bacterium LW23]|nr:PTS fructose transporter subunit EIIBC [Verrucomicrobia bacterium LW23]
MNKIVAVIRASGSPAHVRLAAEALRATAPQMGCALTLDLDGAPPFSEKAIAEADVVIVTENGGGDGGHSRFADKPVYRSPLSEVIRHTREVIGSALRLTSSVTDTKGMKEESVSKSFETATARGLEVASTFPATQAPADAHAIRRLVAITACPTGIAHTFMAAEALQKAAKALGHQIKVETQGSVGAKNQLTEQDVALADAVVIAAETKVDLSRFAGKRLHMISTKEAMRAGKAAIENALALPLPEPGVTATDIALSSSTSGGSLASIVEQRKAARANARTGPYKHLMTGVSYMLPLVTAGGLSIALAFALGGIYAGQQQGTLAAALSQIGGGTAFQLFVAVFAAFISYSIADRPGIAPGLVGGMLAHTMGAGFLGGIAAGFLAGYFTAFLAEKLSLPATLEGLKPVLILPFVSTVTIGLLMIYVVGPPVREVMEGLSAWLNSMRGANALLLGVILGAMMAFDMGGPVNKAAYTFSVGLLASQVYGPMAAVMAAGMTPALAMGVASKLMPGRFDDEEREAGNAALVLGLSLITEGAIPYAAKDPLRVIPALMAGSAVAGGLSMALGVQMMVPHGGLFAALIPGAVQGLGVFLAALAAGTAVTVAVIAVVRRPLAVEPGAPAKLAA